MRGVVAAGLGVGAAALFGVLGAQSAQAAAAPEPPRPSTPAEIAKQDAADKRTARKPKVNSPAEDRKQDADDKRRAADSPSTQKQRAEGRKRAEQQDSESRKAAEQKANSPAEDRKQDAEDKRTAADAGSPERKRERAKGKQAEADRREQDRKDADARKAAPAADPIRACGGWPSDVTPGSETSVQCGNAVYENPKPVSDIAHGALEAWSYAPVVGPVAGGANAVLYGAEGDWEDAAGHIPVAGKGGRAGKPVVRAAGNAASSARRTRSATPSRTRSDPPLTARPTEAAEVPTGRPKVNLRRTVIDGTQHPESAQHIIDNLKPNAKGKYSYDATVNRPGTKDRRRKSLRGVPRAPGKHRDEWPQAVFEEGGEGASVRHLTPADNQGSGAALGNHLRGNKAGDYRIEDGTRIRVFVRPPTVPPN